MRTRLVVAVVILGLVSISSAVLAEETHAGKLNYFGGFVGRLVATDLESYDRTFHDSLPDLNLSSSFMLAVKLGRTPEIAHRMTPIAVELEGSMITSAGAKKSDYLPSPFGSTVDFKSDLSVKSIMANFLLRYPYGRIHPYGGFGLGWSWFDVEDARFFLAPGYQWPETGSNLKSLGDLNEDAFAYQVLIGAGFDLTETISIDVGYRYFRAEPEFNLNDVGFNKYETRVDLDVKMTYTIQVIGLGITFWF